MLAHPENHVGDHDNRDGPDDRLESFLLLLREVLGDDLERHTDGDTD